MSIAKCRSCGAYNGYEEWPDEAKQDYTPDKCYKCTMSEAELKKDRGELEEPTEVSEEPSEIPGEPSPTVEDVGEDNLVEDDFDDEEEEEDEEDAD